MASARRRNLPYQARFEPGLKPPPRLQEKAKAALTVQLKIHWINPGTQPGQTEAQLREIKEVLAQGYPVAAGSSHSRLLVGYADDSSQPGGGAFLTKDSGSGSFDVVTYEFVKTKVGDVFWVEAPPKAAGKKQDKSSR